MRFFHVACWAVFLLLSESIRAQDNPPEDSFPARSWATANMWRIAVDSFEGSAKPAHSYEQLVAIVGDEPVGEEFAWVWRVEFQMYLRPPPKGIKGMAHRHRVMLDKKSGWPRWVYHGNEPPELLAGKPVPIAPIADAPVGFPLELFPFPADADLTYKGANYSLTVSKEVEGAQTLLTAKYAFDDKREVVVKQKWVQGEKWWSEYERYVDGKKDLTARLIEDESKIRKRTTPRSAPRSASDYQKDPRLQVKITKRLEHPTLEEILQLVKDHTGVTLMIGAEVPLNQVLGNKVLYNVPAWWLMQDLEKDLLDGGQWKKDGQGYRLVGQLKRAAGNEQEDAKGAGPWLGLSIFLAVAIAGVSFVVFFVRKGKNPN